MREQQKVLDCKSRKDFNPKAEYSKNDSSLWHAVKKRQDSRRGKHLPKILGYEKHGGKRRKGNQRPIRSVQDLDSTETTVFSYNFFLSKLGMLYKKTIERIQTKLEEYLVKKRY
jgi:hypothetical protein